MLRIKDFFRLIRVINLVFIFLTMYLFRYCIELPVLELTDIEPRLGHYGFFLLVVSVIFIAAGGYVINDYFDLKIDQINKPDRITIDRGVSRRKAMFIHVIFNFLGIFLAGILAYIAGNMFLMLIHAFTALILWFYSTNFKKQFLIGNVVVSLLTALVVLIVPIYDIGWLWKFSGDEALLLRIFNYALLYAFFAFLTSMIREIIKDVEDVKGDGDESCNTIPIVMGVENAKYVVFIFQGLLTILLVWLIGIKILDRQWILVFYGIFFILAPVLYLFYQILKADRVKDFRNSSTIIKIIMLMGILSMLLIYYFDTPPNII